MNLALLASDLCFPRRNLKDLAHRGSQSDVDDEQNVIAVLAAELVAESTDLWYPAQLSRLQDPRIVACIWRSVFAWTMIFDSTNRIFTLVEDPMTRTSRPKRREKAFTCRACCLNFLDSLLVVSFSGVARSFCVAVRL